MRRSYQVGELSMQNEEATQVIREYLAEKKEGEDEDVTVGEAIGLTTIHSQSFSAVIEAYIQEKPIFAAQTQEEPLRKAGAAYIQVVKDASPAQFEGVNMFLQCYTKAKDNEDEIRRVQNTQNTLLHAMMKAVEHSHYGPVLPVRGAPTRRRRR